jgi:hypothetical protein
MDSIIQITEIKDSIIFQIAENQKNSENTVKIQFFR